MDDSLLWSIWSLHSSNVSVLSLEEFRGDRGIYYAKYYGGGGGAEEGMAAGEKWKMKI